SIRGRQERLADSLQQIYAALEPHQRLVIEYKFFEPYFYTMDIPDWGTSLTHCLALGDQAEVVVDTGHHAQGMIDVFIVAQLQGLAKRGAIDLNAGFDGDDERMDGVADRFLPFRIMDETGEADALPSDSGVNFTLDQCRHIEN